MRRRSATSLALLGGAVLLAGCRPGTVTLTFDPEAGDHYRYRYEIEAQVTTTLEGAAPSTTSIDTLLEADVTVVETAPSGVRAEVTLRRDGGAPRTSEVRLDRAGALQGVDLIEGQRADVFGLGDLSQVLPTLAPPESPLAPGDRWSLDAGTVTGEGRLARLGVVDGADVAVVATDATQPLEDTVPTGNTTATLSGELRSRATTAYDLRDGSLRRSTTRARGTVAALIAPPVGIDAAPVNGTIIYDIRVRVTRQR
jgi:hypothetical protein